MSDATRREWRQLRLLSHNSVKRLLDSVVFSREADPMQFALWGLALAMTPPLLIAIRKSTAFPFLLRLPPDVVERIVIADRAYFVIYGMLASALLATLMWDALFPDQQDQEIVGVLPVRPRTLAAARLGAAAGVSLVFAAAINLPGALLYSAGSFVHPIVGGFPRVLAAHVLATTLGCAFVFFGLMSLRAIVSTCAGRRVADRLAVGLQLVTVVLLLEVFLFLPGVLPRLVREMQGGGISELLLPPIWFVALFSYVGEGRGSLTALAPLAVIATFVTVALAVVVSLVPAGLMGRRALETRPIGRAGRLPSPARVVAALCIRSAPVRAIFLFATVSLARSRRHALVLATAIGFALAFGFVRLLSASFHGAISFGEPRGYLLAMPLAFVFFIVFGLRATFALPTDVDANWPFRLAPPSVSASRGASRLMILAFGVAPVTLAWTVVALALWSRPTAMQAAACLLASGWALTEAALANWTKVPFASAHEPSTQTLEKRWPWYVVALYFFSYKLAEILTVVLATRMRVFIYLGAVAVLVAAIRLWAHGNLRKQSPTFDAVNDEQMATLNLSEALN